MRRNLRTIVLALVSLFAGLFASAAPRSSPLSYVIERPHGERTEVRVLPRADGSVEISYDKLHKVFEPAVLEGLRGLWGPDAFGVRALKSDTRCIRVVTWRLKSGSDTRTVCHDRAALEKLDSFQGAIQLLMR